MEYYDLGEKITAFTTDRTVGRDPEKLCNILGVERYARPHQTHTANVLHVDEHFFLLSEEEQEAKMEGIDAIISKVPATCLGISTADCIPVLVYDPEHHACAAVHAGWKGTLQRIVENAMREMQETFGTSPALCRCAIGPGISQDSFEVGWEVHEVFKTAGFPVDDVTVIMPSKDGNGTKPHLDLKEINRLQLLHTGVPATSIQVSDIDTYTDNRFFSARREQHGDEKCGRILTGFVLR